MIEREPGSFENALVEQKNRIRVAVLNAEDAIDMGRALDLLNFVAPMWESVGYGYKVREVRSLISHHATALLSKEHEYLSHCRKNCKTRGSTEANIKELSRIAAVTYNV